MGFIWLDFGLRHVFKCNDQQFIDKINKLKYNIYDTIRIAHIWDLNCDYILHYNYNIYKDIFLNCPLGDFQIK